MKDNPSKNKSSLLSVHQTNRKIFLVHQTMKVHNYSKLTFLSYLSFYKILTLDTDVIKK